MHTGWLVQTGVPEAGEVHSSHSSLQLFPPLQQVGRQLQLHLRMPCLQQLKSQSLRDLASHQLCCQAQLD